jgi:hypothetical protein
VIVAQARDYRTSRDVSNTLPSTARPVGEPARLGEWAKFDRQDLLAACPFSNVKVKARRDSQSVLALCRFRYVRSDESAGQAHGETGPSGKPQAAPEAIVPARANPPA